MGTDCIFCKIIKKEIPSKVVYEDAHILAFNDISPQAKQHILIVPKEHVQDFYSLPENTKILNQVLVAVKNIAGIIDVKDTGFRIVTNYGKDACQSVQHLHFHLMGGDQLSGKMG
jgi:histidine triad (HIT) family protein